MANGSHMAYIKIDMSYIKFDMSYMANILCHGLHKIIDMVTMVGMLVNAIHDAWMARLNKIINNRHPASSG